MWCYFEFWFFFALDLSQKFFVLKSHKSAPFKPWNVKSLCIQYNYPETIKALFLNEINCYYSFKSIKALKTGLIKCRKKRFSCRRKVIRIPVETLFNSLTRMRSQFMYGKGNLVHLQAQSYAVGILVHHYNIWWWSGMMSGQRSMTTLKFQK